MVTAILLAAGSGNRMQGQVADKVLANLNGLPAFCYSLQAFHRSGVIDDYIVVYRDEAQKSQLAAAVQQCELQHLKINAVAGGQERQDSVIHALNIANESCDYVFIHDCARPCVTYQAIQSLHQAVLRDQAASLAHPVIDTIKRIPAPKQLHKVELEDLDRQRLWAMETPQAFNFASILKAYQLVSQKKLSITDDTAAARLIGLNTTLVPNQIPNPKLTTPGDLAYINFLMASRPPVDSDLHS
ncbi:IspD/TarI family cytidylyltransferase [Coraliomargarita sp. SDUM461004]|uniref:IspD/TarI family cytidylyltransferase n=1 Tax=Thalassobacterium sedimentorum TaxID=3041258 RepID=A0ABU1AJ07_9BACT|nr:IspD/TarI family cytidylyltransferase [Coraliomargarita sp. SDUM461004]MDQ8193855.1 IspD/TarI family cytidylyltransferase [Coraliomargarita sp. SDUM461004]